MIDRQIDRPIPKPIHKDIKPANVLVDELSLPLDDPGVGWPVFDRRSPPHGGR